MGGGRVITHLRTVLSMGVRSHRPWLGAWIVIALPPLLGKDWPVAVIVTFGLSLALLAPGLSIPLQAVSGGMRVHSAAHPALPLTRVGRALGEGVGAWLLVTAGVMTALLLRETLVSTATLGALFEPYDPSVYGKMALWMLWLLPATVAPHLRGGMRFPQLLGYCENVVWLALQYAIYVGLGRGAAATACAALLVTAAIATLGRPLLPRSTPRQVQRPGWPPRVAWLEPWGSGRARPGLRGDAALGADFRRGLRHAARLLAVALLCTCVAGAPLASPVFPTRGGALLGTLALALLPATAALVAVMFAFLTPLCLPLGMRHASASQSPLGTLGDAFSVLPVPRHHVARRVATHVLAVWALCAAAITCTTVGLSLVGGLDSLWPPPSLLLHGTALASIGAVGIVGHCFGTPRQRTLPIVAFFVLTAGLAGQLVGSERTWTLPLCYLLATLLLVPVLAHLRGPGRRAAGLARVASTAA